MDYMSEMRAFYDRLETNPLPAPAISLWHALMSVANKTGWQKSFAVPVSVLSQKSGLNAQAVKRARERLGQDGYISWQTRSGSQSAVYRMNSLLIQYAGNTSQYEPQLQDVPQSGPQSVPQSEPETVPQFQNEPQSVPQNEPQSVPQNEPQFQNVPQNVPQNEPQPVPQPVPQSEPINIQDNTKQYISLSVCARAEPGGFFSDFWKAYPKKSDMLNAQGEYMYVLQTTAALTEAELVAAAKNYAEACRIRRTKEQYVKKPGNWLKESTWIEYLPENYKKPDAPQEGRKKTVAFNNFSQRSYDYDRLEQTLLDSQPVG